MLFLHNWPSKPKTKRLLKAFCITTWGTYALNFIYVNYCWRKFSKVISWTTELRINKWLRHMQEGRPGLHNGCWKIGHWLASMNWCFKTGFCIIGFSCEKKCKLLFFWWEILKCFLPFLFYRLEIFWLNKIKFGFTWHETLTNICNLKMYIFIKCNRTPIFDMHKKPNNLITSLCNQTVNLSTF